MARGKAFVILDMPETASAYMALRDQLRELDRHRGRPDLPEGFAETVEEQRKLCRRMHSRLVSAGLKLGEAP